MICNYFVSIILRFNKDQILRNYDIVFHQTFRSIMAKKNKKVQNGDQSKQTYIRSGFLPPGVKPITFNDDLYTALGYPDKITCRDCKKMYQRCDIAAAVIDRPIEKTWQDFPVIMDHNGEEGAFCQALVTLNSELGLYRSFENLDKLSLFGRFSVMVIGFEG